MSLPLRFRYLTFATVALAVGCAAPKNESGPTTSSAVLELGGLYGQVTIQDALTLPDGSVASGAFSDVTVTVTNADDNTHVLSFNTRTDDTGHWALSELPVGHYHVQAFKPAHTAMPVDVTVIANALAPANLVLTAVGVNVSGCAEFPAPGPGSNPVTAQLLLDGQPEGAQGPKTLAPGECEDGQPGFPFVFLGVTPGAYSVSVSSLGFSGQTPRLFFVDDTDVELPTLVMSRQTGVVTGTVTLTGDTSGLGQVSLAGITVTLIDSSTAPAVIATTVTDATGAYQFAAVPVSLEMVPYDVKISSKIFVPADPGALPTISVVSGSTVTVPPIAVKLGTWNVNGCVFVPPPAPDSTGVTLTLTGTTAEGAAWTLPVEQSGGSPCIPGGDGVEGLGSTFELQGVPAGVYTLTLTRQGYMPVTIPVIVPAEDSAGIPTDITLPDVTMMRAYVTLTGQACAKVPADNLLSILGDTVQPDIHFASVTLTGGSLANTVLQASTMLTGGPMDICGNQQTLTYTFVNVPQPLSVTDAYLLGISQVGYEDYEASIRCEAAIDGTTNCAMLPLTAPRDARVQLLDNTITGCVLPPTVDGNTSITVDLSGTAFDGFTLPPAASGSTMPDSHTHLVLDQNSPDCSALGITGVPALSFAFKGVPNGHYTVTIHSSGGETIIKNDLSLSGSAAEETLQLDPVQLEN